EKGLEIIRTLRGWTSGLCVPHFVIDAPGGGGKIPLLPEYVQRITSREVVLRNYVGKEYRYPLPGARRDGRNGKRVPPRPLWELALLDARGRGGSGVPPRSPRSPCHAEPAELTQSRGVSSHAEPRRARSLCRAGLRSS